MISLLRTLLGLFVACVLFVFSDEVIGINEWWVALPISILTSACAVFFKRKKNTYQRSTRRERIINLNNGSVGEIFIRSSYSNYKLISSDANGNSYMSPEGVLVCTKYCNETTSVRSDKINLSNWTHFVISVLLIFMFWYESVDDGLLFDICKSVGTFLCFSAMGTNIALCFMTRNSDVREECRTLSIQFRAFGFVFVFLALMAADSGFSIWFTDMLSLLGQIAIGWIAVFILSLISRIWNKEKNLTLRNFVSAAIYCVLNALLI